MQDKMILRAKKHSVWRAAGMPLVNRTYTQKWHRDRYQFKVNSYFYHGVLMKVDPVIRKIGV